MARFEYQEDALQPGEIRLLRVQKAPNAKEFPLGGGPDSNSTPLYAPIQCEIETYKLRDCPPFTALSYTWGAEDNEKEISLNGLSKTVRLNLARFLRHARDDMNSYPSGSASSWRQKKRGKRSYFYPPDMLWEMVAPHSTGDQLGPGMAYNMNDALQYLSDPSPWPEPSRKEGTSRTSWPKGMLGKSMHTLVDSIKKLTDSSSHAPIGYLWIDALCINQENVRERNAQVAIMRDIYKEAKRIVRWLGTGCTCHDYPYLATEAYRRYARCAESMRCHFNGSSPTVIPENVLDTIKCLGSNEWWSRSWILQEASTPRATMELWVGPSRVSFEDMKFVHYCMLWAMGMYRQAAIPSLYNKTLDVLGELAKSRLGDAKMTLLDLLVTGRRFKASEPRDKVYAFLGIYEDVRGEKSPIPIDYALPVSEVFKKTTIHILQEAGDLNILAHCGSARNEVTIPSWVPDFSVPGDHHLAICPDVSEHSQAFKPSISLENNMNRVVVTGKIVGHVAEIVPPLLPPDVEISEDDFTDFALNSPQFLAWFMAIARMAYPDAVEVEYPGGVNTSIALDLLFMGKKDRPAAEHSALMGPPFLQVLKGGTFVSPLYRAPMVIAMVRQRYPSLAFFRTRKGYLGFGDEATEPGDAIVQLHGLSVPLVLRKCGGTWRLLGSCFVVGIMSGEIRKTDYESTVFRID